MKYRTFIGLSFIFVFIYNGNQALYVHTQSISGLVQGRKKICETERLVLSEFIPEDVASLAEIMADPEVMYFSPSGPRSFEATEIYLKKTIKNNKENGYGKWAVIHKESSKIIGICGLQKAQIDDEIVVELGYRFAKEFWGKGLATEAAQAVKQYAFNVLGLPKIVSCIEEANRGSIRVAEKNGMQFWKKSLFLGEICNVYQAINPKFI